MLNIRISGSGMIRLQATAEYCWDNCQTWVLKHA